MHVLIDLALAVIAFIVAQWLLGLTGLAGGISLVIAVFVAVIVFFQHPSARFV